MKKFNDAETMDRVWAVYQIKNLMGRRAYYNAYGMLKEELDEIWVEKPENMATASFGINWGYQVGMDNIRRNYGKVNAQKRGKYLAAVCRSGPKTGKVSGSDRGSMIMHALASPLIEIADDGLTAQSMWYSPGQVTVTCTGSSHAMLIYERCFADFIREDEEWKLWHLFVGTDITIRPGDLMSEQPIEYPKFDFSSDKNEAENILTHEFETYTTRYNYSHYPRIPVPYKTFADAVSNGPEGNPKFK